MRCRLPSLLLALSIGWSTPMHAQLPSVEDLLEAAKLPLSTTAARSEGAASTDIRSVLEAMRRARIPAHEATAVIDTARVARREHGPTGNFGAFVQAQLAEGKRGRELAAAIRAEHQRQGKGNGNAAGGARGQGQARGQGNGNDARRPDAADTGRGRGNASQPGRGADTGSKGKARGQGRGNSGKPNR